MGDLFSGLSEVIEFDPGARRRYESRVASRDRVLDIGGRNAQSKSRQRLAALSRNPRSVVVSTDVFDDYEPDIVDDICDTTISPDSFDAIYCDAVLEHVQEYWRAIDNIHKILKPGGEAFLYVPFFYHFHDRTDYHRFTFTEVGRMLAKFPEVRILAPGKDSGFGSVLCNIASYGQIERFPRVNSMLSSGLNFALRCALNVAYTLKKPDVPRDRYLFFYTYLRINHGFCAYVRK